MKKTLLKTLAAATMLVVGSANAMADAGDITTEANIDFSNAIVTDESTSVMTVAGTVGTMTIGSASTTIATDGYLVMASGDNTVTIAEADRAGSNDVVTVSFELSLGNSSGKKEWVVIKDAENDTIAYFNIGRYTQTLSSNLGFVADGETAVKDSEEVTAFKNAFGQGKSSTYPHGQLAPVEITLDYNNGTITTKITSVEADTITTKVTTFNKSKNVPATFIVGTDISDSDRYPYFDNLKITTARSITKSIGTSGFATFSAAKNTIVPTGVTVYTAAKQSDGTTVLATSLDDATAGAILPSGTGFIINGSASADYYFVPTTDDATVNVESNDLVPNTESTTITGSTSYGLLKDEKTFALISENATLAANTAYLTISGTSAKSLQLVFDDGTATAVSKIVAAESASDGKVYNLAGQQVSEDYKGVVIKNGKKYLNK